ncbi:glyoxylase-like metal-dependent hydrolase (beta-lactamase superfamily II) [Labedella gwakjiensis]|uniref:Glyoxylase-like metal-dependent hydrolase (Beta-lactamase superfamily II) n=1 Tax=Labedella gwakjiensis TaxID=390269 RepID=A0A2P8GSW4_9MICO|nr:MBL fold metallo-hydrolase [Labedella gwakjiensis]PSL37051.1 glyoxylase-like metal-dependent hydrolase (beta-lactamase superfamily II) [Labedella gwakjiensis]RUQ82038.1 MBL fold metallo-hydrolase [Labedella gwakjiensis]
MTRGAGIPSLPVADPWFRVRPSRDGRILQIDEPHVDPLVAANVWIVRGRDRDLVVDTGLGVVPLPSVGPWLIERDPVVVVTHAHLDHAGGASAFPAVHAHASEDLAHPREASLHGGTELDLLGITDASIRADVGEWLLSAVPHHGFDVARYSVRAPRGVVEVEDGYTIDLGDRRLTVLHLPGHSPGSVALFDEHDGALFSGDVVYDDVLFDELDGADQAAYVRSLERLLSLDVRTVYPGHGDAFGADRLAEIVARHIASRRGASGG